MRAGAGDPPRTMAQKILAARSSNPALVAEMVEVQVDQVVLARAPGRAFAEALTAGLKKAPAEVVVAYDSHCVTGARSGDGERSAFAEMLGHGILVARPA